MTVALRQVHPQLTNPIPKIQIVHNTGRLRKIGRCVFLGLLGTGIVGGEVANHTKINQQATQVLELSKEITKSNSAIAQLIAENEELKQKLEGKVTLDQIKEVAKEILPSCVYIEGEKEGIDFFTGQIEKYPTVGSGVIIRDINGTKYILTNAHVLNEEGNTSAQNTNLYHIKLFSRSDLEAPIEFDASPFTLPDGEMAYSPPDEHDLALLEIPGHIQLPDNLGANFRDLENEDLEPGEIVIAIGNPYGQKDSMSVGFVSNANRDYEINKNHYFQTDAAINPGNSGGPSFDIKGRLIGINSINIGPGVGGAIRGNIISDVLDSWGIVLHARL